MVWNKPKQVINNLLVYLAIISGGISVFAIFVMLVWVYSPKTINQVDEIIPDFYGNSIKKNYKKAIEAESSEEQLVQYTRLYEKLKDISSLEKYYTYKQKTNEYLTNYYLDNNLLNKASKISKKWEKNSPYDFYAKFNYLNVLNITNPSLAAQYYEDLYTKHPRSDAVVRNYILSLIKNGFIDKALETEGVFNQDYNKEYNKAELSFELFYMDDDKNYFNGEQKINLDYMTSEKDNRLNYVIKIKKEFKNLKGLRLDLDSVFLGDEVKFVDMSIINNNKKFSNIEIEPMNSMRRIGNQVFMVVGDDAHVKLVLPEELNNGSGSFEILMSLSISNEMHIVQYHIMKNKKKSK